MSVSFRFALMTSVLVTGLLSGALTTPAAAAPGDTALTIVAKDKVLRFADARDADVAPVSDIAVFDGVLTQADTEEPIAGQAVALELKLAQDALFTVVASEVTDAAGEVQFKIGARGNGEYRLAFAGDESEPTLGPATSEVATVKVMRDFNGVVWRGKKRAVGLKGNINPGWGGKVIKWQKKSCDKCKWKTIRQARAKDSGAWRFAGSFPSRVGARWYYRAKIKGGGGFISSRSGVLKTKVVKNRTVARQLETSQTRSSVEVATAYSNH